MYRSLVVLLYFGNGLINIQMCIRDRPGADGHGECIVTHLYENIISSDFFNIPELSEVVNLLEESGSGILFKGAKVKRVGDSLKKMVSMKGLERYIDCLLYTSFCRQKFRLCCVIGIERCSDIKEDY